MVDSGKDRSDGAKGYQWNPDDYARNSGQQAAWAMELLSKLKLSGHEEVLDIGCGEGKVTAAIADRLQAGRVVGIDNSPRMIDYARDKFQNPSRPNLQFFHIDVRRLAFREEFDLAFSNAALHWVRDHRQFLPLVRRALKPGGRVLFQMGGRGNAGRVMEIVDEMTRASPWSPYFHGFEFPYGFHGPDEYRTWLEEAGLKAASVKLFTKDMQHKGEAGMAGWFRSTWLPFIERVPPEQRDRFIAQAVGGYIQKYGMDARGMVHLEMVRLEVEATRPD